MKAKHYAKVGRIFNDLEDYPLGELKNLNNKPDVNIEPVLDSNTSVKVVAFKG